jgi:hypothetical protein
VVSGTVTIQFTYNDDGDRVSQTINGVPTYYAFDPAGLAQVLVATSGGQSKKYVPGLAQFNASGWTYQLPDGLGSVRQLTDPAGQISLIQNYDPFGNVLQQVGAASMFGYTGEQADPTGLVFLRARYYNPTKITPISFSSLPPQRWG